MSNVKYTPGNEPKELKLKLQRFFEKVNTAYPDKVLYNFYRDHKKWGEALTKLRRELGYDDNTSFWEAYGYTVVVQGATALKTADDYQKIIDELKKRYEGRACPAMNRLSIENPDLSGKIKTLQNKAPTVFGMTLKEKLVAEGVLQSSPRARSSIEIPQKTQEERFEETLQVLKDKYINADEKPSSLAELKVANKNLSLGPQFYSYIKSISGKKAEEYLAEQGIIFDEKMARKLFNNDDFDISPRGILKQYKGNNAMVVIPDCVKKILKKAFDGHRKKIEEIVIPDSVEVIEDNAFRELSNLKTVKLSKNLKVIETCLFSECNELYEVVIPNGVEVIKAYAFNSCNSIKRVNIPSTVKIIEHSAWSKAESIEEFIVDTENEYYISVDGVIYNKEQTELCIYPLGKNVAEFVVPNGVKTIGVNAFTCSNKLKTVILPQGLESIEHSAFGYCESLEKVDVPNSIKNLGAFCFSHCMNLKYISLPNDVETESNVFWNCYALAKDGFIIINDVLYDCTLTDVSKISVPNGVKSIKRMSGIGYKEMYIPDSIEYFFDMPYSIEYVSVPSTLKNLDELKSKVKDRETKVFVRPDKNDVQFIKYYAMPNLNDMNGKGVLLDIQDECLKTKVRAILKHFNASVKRVMSKNVDYVVTEDSTAHHTGEKHSELVKTCVKSTDETDKPMLIIVDELIEANESYFNNRFVSMSNPEKFSWALSLYDTCIKKVETMMDNIGTYSDPICSGSSTIRAEIHPHAKITDADGFLDEVVKFNESWGDSPEKISEAYRSIYKEVFSEYGSDFGECVGIEAAIAIAVACFIFGSPDCDVYIEWVRDKWESRGDYSSSFNVAFELSRTFPDGRLSRSGKEAYDM